MLSLLWIRKAFICCSHCRFRRTIDICRFEVIKTANLMKYKTACDLLMLMRLSFLIDYCADAKNKNVSI